MALFQYKIGWKIMRQRENKNYRSFCPHPPQNRKFQKNSKKIQKIKKKIPLWHHFKPKQVGKSSKRENKNYRFVSFQPDA